jgi:hypothetical protein
MRLVKAFLCGISAIALSTGMAFAGGVPHAFNEADPSHSASEMSASNDDREVFSRFDSNSDGSLSWSESQADPNLAYVFEDGDLDGNEQLSQSEFDVLATSTAEPAELIIIEPIGS